MIKDPDPGGVDKNLVALAPRNHLGIAGNNAHLGLVRCGSHRLEDFTQVIQLEPFFQDQTHTDRQRSRAAHRQIIDRTIDGQVTDVATGKNNRIDHITVGRECYPAGVYSGKNRSIILLCLRNLRKAGNNQLVE